MRSRKVARGLITAYDEGHCPDLGTNGDFIRYFLGSMLFYDKLRDLVPATVHRFDRCNADDIEVLVQLYYAVTGALGQSPGPSTPPGGVDRLRRLTFAPPPPAARFLSRPVGPFATPPPSDGNTGEGFSYGLFYHVTLSEMWYAPGEVTSDEVTTQWEALTMSTGLETWLAPKVDWWPLSERDSLWGGTADFDGPLLMLLGGLDPATTPEPALELALHYTAPGQTLAFFPQGAHGLVDGTTLPDGANCGELLLLAFLEDPRGALDLTCIDETLGVQWDGYETYNQYFMGTQDIWGDE